MTTVPAAFAETTVAYEGEGGTARVAGLPHLVETLCEGCGLRVGGRPMLGTWRLAVPAVRNGVALALKISWLDQGSEQEPLVLRA